MGTDIEHQRIGMLDQLAEGRERSKAAQLRDIYDKVEAAIARGVTHEALVQGLAATGLDFTVASFRTTLGRIRRARRSQQSVAAFSPPGAVADSNLARPGQSISAPSSAEVERIPPAGVVERAATTDDTSTTKTVSAALGIASQAAELPHDWLTAEFLTRDQIKMLSPAQRAARRSAMGAVIRATYFGSPYRGLKVGASAPPADQAATTLSMPVAQATAPETTG